MDEHFPTLDDFLSRDPHRVWRASCAVQTCFDRAVLKDLAAHIDQIEVATAGLDLGGAFRPNSDLLALALRILRFVLGQSGCLCTFFPDDPMYDLHHLTRLGHVRHGDPVDDPASYCSRYDVICEHCGAEFDVAEQLGWHVPLWTWTRVSRQPD